MQAFMIILVILLVYIGVKVHHRQLFLSEQCKYCKYCKACKPCKANKTCQPKRKFEGKSDGKSERKTSTRQTQKTLPKPSKIPENASALKLHEITDDQIDRTIENAHSLDDAEKELQTIYLRESINALYMNSLCPGDDGLYKKMKHIGRKDIDAIKARVRYHKHLLAPYVSQELADNENREWWSDDVIMTNP